MITVGILDDHPVVLHALSNEFADQSFKIVFQITEQEKLFEYLKNTEPDVLILDILLPGIYGIDLFKRVISRFSSMKIISYSTLGSPILVQSLLSAGVHAYVNKRQSVKDVALAIETVTSDSVYVPKEYQLLIKEKLCLAEDLSRREVEIVNLIKDELTSKEIAERLYLSIYTVENHRKNIFKKFRVQNLGGMLSKAMQLGYLS